MVRRRFDFLAKLVLFCGAVTFIFFWSSGSKFEPHDYKNPIPLNDGLKEAIRLNELVAQVQYSCRSSSCFPTERCWSVCWDLLGTKDAEKGPVQLLSIPSMDSLTFERNFLATFPKTQATVVASSSSDRHAIAKLKKLHPQLNVIQGDLTANSKETDILPSGKFVRWKDVLQLFNSQSTLPLLVKWDCTHLDTASDCASLLEEFIAKRSAFRNLQQLHLTVRIAFQDSPLIFRWYQLLNDLFFTAHLALYSSAQRGECGRVVYNCEYRLSFMRLPSNGTVDVLAPVMGMGSPEEEYSRFISYATTLQHTCDTIGVIQTNYFTDGYESSSWRLCSDNGAFGQPGRSCKIYFFSFRDLEVADTSFVQPLINENCDVHFFDTTLPKSRSLPEQRLHFHKWGLASKTDHRATYKQRSGLELLSLSEIVKQLGHTNKTIDVMMWDIEGHEWAVLGVILTSGILQNFNQLIIRSRLWFGEENHNFREFFTYLYRLRLQGLRLFDVTRINSDKCRHCVQFGWLRVAAEDRP